MDYDYGGQWFDDMGALSFALRNSPAAGVDIARMPGLTRQEQSDMAGLLARLGFNPYEES